MAIVADGAKLAAPMAAEMLPAAAADGTETASEMTTALAACARRWRRAAFIGSDAGTAALLTAVTAIALRDVTKLLPSATLVASRSVVAMLPPPAGAAFWRKRRAASRATAVAFASSPKVKV